MVLADRLDGDVAHEDELVVALRLANVVKSNSQRRAEQLGVRLGQPAGCAGWPGWPTRVSVEIWPRWPVLGTAGCGLTGGPVVARVAVAGVAGPSWVGGHFRAGVGREDGGRGSGRLGRVVAVRCVCDGDRGRGRAKRLRYLARVNLLPSDPTLTTLDPDRRPPQALGRRPRTRGRAAARHRRGADARLDGRRGAGPDPDVRAGDVLEPQPPGVLGQGRDLRPPPVGQGGPRSTATATRCWSRSTRKGRPATPAPAPASTPTCCGTWPMAERAGRRRTFGPVVLLGLASAGLAAVAGNRPGWSGPGASEGQGSLLTGHAGTTRPPCRWPVRWRWCCWRAGACCW